ncbi:unnamed protein product [Cochlearia groenlandica]
MRRYRYVVQVFSDASLFSNASTTISNLSVAMSHRPLYGGFRGRGRGRGGRSFSDHPYNDAGRDQFVTGDSHYQSVHDANLEFRHGNRVFSSSNQPPYNQNREFRPPSSRGQWQQFHQHNHSPSNQNYSACPPPPFYQNQMSRPHPPQGSFRQRPRSKPSDYREWEYAKRASPPGSEKFVVLSYNILADYLANDHRGNLYFHIPRKMLSWGWRKKKIVFELGLWSADIMCLQEVDKFQDLDEELKLQGYSGIWKMRTGNAVDGCAIFWRSNRFGSFSFFVWFCLEFCLGSDCYHIRFKLVHEESIQFNQLGLRDNVAQICVLETLLNLQTKENEASPSESCSGRVVVCNIHVLFNPKRGDFKVGQVRTLLEKAHAVSKLWDDAPVVLCGDFNCTPKSHLYNFISEQKLDLSGLARDKVSGQDSATIRPQRPEMYTTRFQSTNTFPQGQGQPQDAIAKARLETNSNISVGNINSNAQEISSSLIAKIDTLTLDEPVEIVQGKCEDEETFLAKLDNNEELSQKEEPMNEFSSKPVSEAYNCGQVTYNPSSWTPMEIATATGDPERTMVEHAMELKSTYSEIEGKANTRDENGEPVVTSYHRCFMGTVDYIWRSEGLETVRVLSPIPKQAMQWTPGFPTPKWGSDHIALVSELAFCSKGSSKSIPPKR